MNLPRRSLLAVLAVTAAANVALLAYYHDRFWWPPDDGFLAHVAARLSAGEVVDRDIEENHPGYTHFIHLAAFRLFGEDFVSLRYPLAAAAFTQGMMAVALVAGAGWLEALLAGLASVILGVLQFLNPHPHWYCSAVALAIALLLTYAPRESRWRLPAVGFLLSIALLFRQLTGVFLIGAVAVALLAEPGEARTAVQKLGARLLLGLMALGLVLYQAATTDLFGLILFGAWPVLLAGAVAGATEVSNRQMARQAVALLLGGLAAFVPLLAYHALHGSLFWWYQDTVVRAVGVVDLPYLRLARYWHLLVGGIAGVSQGGSARLFVNGLYWCLLPLLAAAAGAGTLLRFRRKRRLPPLLAIAVFYGLVALFNQIAIYVYYTAALSLAALLLLTAEQPRRWLRMATAGTAVFLLVVALAYHAAQPLSRGPRGIIEGTTTALVPSGLPRCRLQIDPTDRETYRAVVARVAARTAPDDPIFVFPNHAEVYFLTGRRNPFRFYSTALGLQDPEEARAALKRLGTLRPKLILHAPSDHNTTAFSRQLLEGLAASHRKIETIGPFDLYEPRDQ